MAAYDSTKDRLDSVNLLIKNTGQYLANKQVYKAYLAAKDKEAFRGLTALRSRSTRPPERF